MSLAVDIFTVLCLLAGLVFFAAGSIGLIRLPDPLSRLHGLTKADNVGLFFVVLGLLPQAGSVLAAVKMLLIWLLLQVAAGTVAQILAEYAQALGRSGGGRR